MVKGDIEQVQAVAKESWHATYEGIIPREIHLEVEKENAIGTTFYKAKGFKIVDEYDDDFDGHILKTVRMELIL